MISVRSWPKAADRIVSAGSGKKSASAPKVGRPKEFDRDSTLLAAAFYTTVLEGLSIQASDGASKEKLNRIIDAAMLAWPPA